MHVVLVLSQIRASWSPSHHAHIIRAYLLLNSVGTCSFLIWELDLIQGLTHCGPWVYGHDSGQSLQGHHLVWLSHCGQYTLHGWRIEPYHVLGHLNESGGSESFRLLRFCHLLTSCCTGSLVWIQLHVRCHHGTLAHAQIFQDPKAALSEWTNSSTQQQRCGQGAFCRWPCRFYTSQGSLAQLRSFCHQSQQHSHHLELAS